METSQLRLMAHQESAVAFLQDRIGGALLMDRGTGKTPVMVVTMDRFPPPSVILYLAPKSTLHSVRRECMAWAGCSATTPRMNCGRS